MKDINNNCLIDEIKEGNNPNYDAILKTFLTDSDDINSKNECGWTPLYRTIVAENSQATEIILNIGADPNIKCNMGETALFQAVEMDSFNQVEILLKKGANPNIPQNDGRIPLHSATVKQNLQIVELLLNYGSNPNTQGKLYGQTPLHLAVKNSVKPTILLLLVKNGGSLLIKDKYDKKPTDYVETDEMRDTINMLKLQGEVPETPKKDLLLTPSKLSKKDFLMIAKTLSDQKTRKEFENYFSSNNEFHPYNIKINNLKLDDFIFRDNSISSNNNQNSINNINVIDDYKEKDNFINNNSRNNVSNFNTFGNNNSNTLNINSDLEKDIIHRKYLSNDISNENSTKNDAFYEMIKQRSASSINFFPNNNNNNGNNNFEYINIISYPSNFNLNNTSNLSNQSGNINNDYNINNLPILSNLNNKINSPFLSSNNNQNNSPLFPFPNLNNNNNLNFFSNLNASPTPIHISSDGVNLTKNNVSSSDSNNLSNITNNIPRPENKQTAVNSPNFVKNNGHFERLNSSQNSANNSKSDINELNKNDSYNAIFNHNNKNNEEVFNNKNLNQENKSDYLNCENILERKISSKSDFSEENISCCYKENNLDNELDNSNHSSQNDNNNYNSNKNNYKNSNAYFRSTYLPTIESKGSEFESEYEKDVKSHKNSFLNNNKYDERLVSHENIVNKEFKNSEKKIEVINNDIRYSHDINRNSDLKVIDDVERCFSQEISRKKNDNLNLKRNQSDKGKKNLSVHTNPIPEIEDDHENEENLSRNIKDIESDNERLNDEDLRMDYYEIPNSDLIDNLYDNTNSETKDILYDSKKISIDNKKYYSSNNKESPNSNDDVNYENNGIISDTNPLDIVNPYPSTKYNERQNEPYSIENKENFNTINLNENKNNLEEYKNIINFKLDNSNLNINKINSNSDSIDEDEETIGNINNKISDLNKRGRNSNHIFSKDFYEELNFYGSPLNSNNKKSYIVSELHLTSNRKSRDSIKKIDLSSRLKNEKLDFSNYSQAKNNNHNNNCNNKLNLTDIINSPNNFNNSDMNRLNLTTMANQITSRSGSDNYEKKRTLNKNTISNSMSNNVLNSKSTNNISESNITNSNAFKKIPYSKNQISNSNTSKIYLNNSTRQNLKSLDERENLKNYANSFIDPNPYNMDYTSNRIDFNYNSNNKNSPRYDTRINQSAFIKTNNNFNEINKSKNKNNSSCNNTSAQNSECFQSDNNNMNKSNLSPNSQKKLNYFNTDICDISISKKPKHMIEKGININKESVQSMEEKPTNKFRYNSKLLENNDHKYNTERGNLSARNLTQQNILKTETNKENNNPEFFENNLKNDRKNRVDFPPTICYFDDLSPRNYNISKVNNVNSEYLFDDTNITNYNHNFAAYNENCDINDINNSCGNNYLNNTMNHINYNTNSCQVFNSKLNNNSHNYSYVSERNNIYNQRKNFKIHNSYYNNKSPKSKNEINYNSTLKKPKRDNDGEFVSQINNNNQDKISKNNVCLETLYYGPDNSNLNRTQSSAISKTDAKKLHNWLISMNMQIYYNNFIERGIVNIDQILFLAANEPDNKLTYFDLENLGIRKAGHIFKILTRIEFDAKNIDQNLSFLINHININKNSVSNSQLNLRISDTKFVCCGFTKEDKKQADTDKPQNLDLIAWLKYVNLPHLRKNFLHNGFDSIEYLLLQCFSIYLVDEALLENYMHIYNKSDRKRILSQLAKDLNLINKKICNQSINFNNFDLLTEHENSEKSEPGCKGCNIF